MRDQLGSLVDVIERLIDALEAADIPYALGGAIAYSAWAEPRGSDAVSISPVQLRRAANIPLIELFGTFDGDHAASDSIPKKWQSSPVEC